VLIITEGQLKHFTLKHLAKILIIVYYYKIMGPPVGEGGGTAVGGLEKCRVLIRRIGY